MGQKINPISLRLKANLVENTKWCITKNYADGLQSDLQIRKYLENYLDKKNILLGGTQVKRGRSRLEVFTYIYPMNNSGEESSLTEEDINKMKDVICTFSLSPVDLYFVNIQTLLPSKVFIQSLVRQNKIAKNNLQFLQFRNSLLKKFGRYQNRPYFQEIFDVLEASILTRNVNLFAKYVSLHLGKDTRHNFFLDFVNKVIREYVLFYPSLSGIRLQVKGRINGSERSRKEVFQTGNISLQTATNKLNYCCTSAFTIYGTCGLKVWMSFDN
jgi:hypothetical protein